MQLTRLLLVGALCAGLAIPAGAFAQNTQTAGTVTGNPNTGARPHRRHGPGLLHRAMRGITLTDAQRQQMHTLVRAYAQEHPTGSPRDPQGVKALRASLLNVLTPDQQAAYLSNRRAIRQRRRAAANPPRATPPP